MSNNPLSNMSYTNKDFNSIYKELLDLVKTLTYKWDPSVSNESDPGNILLKLDAIIGDKNNYNIDKNILENFPETLTQDISARSLYKQLAYRMPWYQSATTDVTFKWLGKDNNDLSDFTSVVKIDKFQLLTDANSEFVYTTLDDVVLTKAHKSQSVRVIEGVINTLNLNGQQVIELNNLDHYNRLYFNETSVAENGIFIYNVNGSENDYWQMVDNLQVEPLGNKYFEFGIDSRRNLCYVEFPSDINTLIGNGLIVKYIVTSGSQGNIISKTLDRFYEDVSVQVNGNDTVLDRNLIYISNPSGTTNGSDPEDLRTAYNKYRQTAGTFHTLVTLRDYINAVYNSGLVSNVKVCDRLNDVQSTYEIVPDSTYGNDVITQLANSGHRGYIGYAKTGTIYDNKPDSDTAQFFAYNNGQMQTVTLTDDNWRDTYTLVTQDMNDLEAFDLKLYLLHSPGQVKTLNEYQSTFNMEPYNSSTFNNVISYIDEQRCVQHDFTPILPNLPCLFKNSYPLDIKIIPHYKLGEEQVNELKVNINKALFSNLNSYYTQFGEEPSYDKIYDIIFSADDRIKALILDDFIYTTFATYWDDKSQEFKDIPVSDFNSDNIRVFDTKTVMDANLSYLRTTLGETLYKNLYLVVKKLEEEGKATRYNVIYKIDSNGVAVEYSSLLQQFRTDIIAKSILAGRTPFAEIDNLFQYTVDQQKEELTETSNISTYIEIYPHGSEDTDSNWHLTAETKYKPITITKENKPEYKSVSYQVGENENIRFLAPSFTTKKTFANYVKYELILASNLYTKRMKFTYDDYKTSPDEFVNEPIEYHIISEGHDENGNSKQEVTVINTFRIPYDPIWQEWLNSENKDDILGTDISIYGNRIVNIYNGNTVVYGGKTLKETLLEHGSEIISNWGANPPTYVVESNLYVEDLQETYTGGYNQADLAKLNNGQAEMFYTVNVATVPSDTDYELKDGEYITFFYKEEDSDSAPYIFEKYGPGTIIRPSFPLQGVAIGETKVNISSLSGNKGEITYSELTVSNYQKILNMYNYNDLSGTKSIAIRDINQVRLNSNEYGSYYFITNTTTTDNKYKLTPDENGCYTLNNEEYFIHLNYEKTMFEMLGAGTLLTFFNANTNTPFTDSLTVNKVDYVEIANKGLSSFVDSCNSLASGSGIDIVVTEQQLFNFSKGDIVTFTLKEEVFERIKSDSDVITGLVLKTDTQTPIIDYNIGYQSASSSGKLPNISLSNNEYVWNATAVLNLYCSYDEPQLIAKNKKNMTDTSTGEHRGSVYREITINGRTLKATGSDLYMLCNIALNKVGGTNIDVTYIDSYGSRTSPHVFIYTINQEYIQNYRNTNLVKLTDGSIMVKLPNLSEDGHKGTLQLNIGTYDNYKTMLKIKNINDKVKFKIQNKNAINCINNSEENGYGVYYYELDNDTTSVTLEFTSDESYTFQETDSLIICPLCKFHHKELFEDKYGITQNEINERISYYDIDKVFDYTYKVNTDKYIEDPLEAKSFFNSAHIFNYFTIPMADLYMSDKSESSITLINNR